MAHIWFVITCYSVGAAILLYLEWEWYKQTVRDLQDDIAFERSQHEWIPREENHGLD